MELGTKLRQARLDAGLSQRQLCEGIVTRNMLSQIENGAAKPSMDTLRLLAARLEKPLSWFLEENALTSPNQEVMDLARSALEEDRWADVLKALEDFRGPDDSFCREAALLRYLALTELGASALEEGRLPYARTLLCQAGEVSCVYITEAMEQRRRVLLVRSGGDAPLPDCDEVLLLRAQQAHKEGRPERALVLLQACEERRHRWQLLCGLAHMARKDYAAATEHLLAAEEEYPAQTRPRLEEAFRELGDFKRAYEYACKNRGI